MRPAVRRVLSVAPSLPTVADRFLKILLAVFRGPTVCPDARIVPGTYPADPMPRYLARAPRSRRRFPARVSLGALIGLGLLTSSALTAAEVVRRSFDIPAGDAAVSLKKFSAQSGEELLYSPDDVRGVQIHAVRGEFVPFVALEVMLERTPLRARQDAKTKAIAITAGTPSRAPPRASETTVPPTPPNPPLSQSQTSSVMKNRPFLSLIAALVGTTAPLGAQTSSGATAQEAIVLSPFSVSAASTGRYQATESTSSGRIRISLLDSTQSVSVVTRDLIDDIGAGRILDAAKYVSGVYESTIPNALDRTTVRGFQSDGATIDGFNYNSFGNVDPSIIERIEVVKGPNAILAPQGVPGGTVNIVTKKPRFTDGGSATAQVGRYDANRAETDVNRVLVDGKFAFRLVAAAERSEHIAGGNYKNSTTVLPMFTYRPFRGTEVTLQAQLFNTWGGAYGGLPIDLYAGTNSKANYISGVSRDLDLYTKLASRHSSGQYYRLLVTSVLTEHLSMRLAANHTNYAGSSVGISIGNPNGTGLLVTRNEQTGAFAWNGVVRNDDPSFNRSGNVGFQTRQAYNLQHDFVYDLKLDGIKSTTVAGYAIDYLQNPNYSVNFTMPAFSIRSFTVQPYTYTTVGSNAIDYRKANQIYINQTLSFLDDRLKLNAGVARSSYENYQNDFFPGRTRTNGITPKATLPSVGVLYKPLPGVALFAGYSKQATAQFVSSTSTPVKPTQDSKQWEVGARVQLLDQRLFATLTYFDIKQNNFGVPNPANAFVPPPVPLLPPLLTDRIAHGVELELTFVISKNLSLVGNTTVMKNRDTDGVPFRGTAEKSGAAWLNYTGEKGGALDGWSFGAGFDYLAKRPGDLSQAFTSLSTPTNIIRQQPSFYLPARTLINVKASYRFDKNWSAQLNVDNILDKEYLAASTARNTVFPGTPINPKLSVTYKF